MEGLEAAKPLTRAELDLRLDLTQMILDLTGIADPTPTADGMNALISLARGDWLGAGISAVSIVPYVGDLAKAGKFPLYQRTLERAVQMAKSSPAFLESVLPLAIKLRGALDLIADASCLQLRRLNASVDELLALGKAPKVIKAVLPDVSKQFRFKTTRMAREVHVEASGRLGVPGKVKQHRNPSEQSTISSGTGDDAGHLIANEFGAPGTAENLAQQNRYANRYGTYRELERYWGRKLKGGVGIEVHVRDSYKLGEPRPYKRSARWVEIAPNGTTTRYELDFGNFHTKTSRDQQGVRSELPANPEVIPVDFRERRRID